MELPGGPAGNVRWQPGPGWETRDPACLGSSLAPRFVLSPPGLSSSFSASRICSKPHVSRVPLGAAAAGRGAAMIGVETPQETRSDVQIDQRGRHFECGGRRALCLEGGARSLGRGLLCQERNLPHTFPPFPLPFTPLRNKLQVHALFSQRAQYPYRTPPCKTRSKRKIQHLLRIHSTHKHNLKYR